MRKRSIRSKITLCLMAIITVMILLSGILSVIFIKKYYYNELKNNLIQTYQECDAFFKDSSNKNRDGSYDLDSMESLLENKSDAMIYIVDDVHMKIYTTVNEDTAVFNNLKSIGEFLMFSDSIDANNSQIEREDRSQRIRIQLRVILICSDFWIMDLLLSCVPQLPEWIPRSRQRSNILWLY